MLSRSSSNYKPLGESQNLDSSQAEKGISKAEDDINSNSNHEMTNISVIRGVNSVVESSGQSKVMHKLGNDIDYRANRKNKRESMDWTNFHCILTTGIVTFLIFWIFLLLRMYLPLENVVMVWWLKKPNKTAIFSTQAVTATEFPFTEDLDGI